MHIGRGEIALCIQRFPMLEPDGCPRRSLDAEAHHPGKVLPHVDHRFAVGRLQESDRRDFLVRPHQRSIRRHQVVLGVRDRLDLLPLTGIEARHIPTGHLQASIVDFARLHIRAEKGTGGRLPAFV